MEEISPIHAAQLLSYFKSRGLQVGLMNNFKVQQLKSGIKRMVRSCLSASCALRGFRGSKFLLT